MSSLSSPSADGVPASVERKLASGARQSERAIVVGSRAGVIEWANDAWTRVTGYALNESISKPVAGFLAEVDIDHDVIEFVSGCFQQGRVCELELPLTPPHRSELWIHLRVEPLFDARGEPSDFIASATDITSRKRAESPSSLAEVDLSAVAARGAISEQPFLGETITLDAQLDPSLPPVLADRDCIESLVARLVSRGNESIGGAWGTITIWTGILGDDDGPLYTGNLIRELPPGHWAFLEVHDSGGLPGGQGNGRVREPFLSTRFSGHCVRYAEAEAWLRGQGAELRMESSYVDGTSVVMLFPFASEDSGWQVGAGR
jgi:PAS domain S-box-containing protein